MLRGEPFNLLLNHFASWGCFSENYRKPICKWNNGIIESLSSPPTLDPPVDLGWLSRFPDSIFHCGPLCIPSRNLPIVHTRSYVSRRRHPAWNAWGLEGRPSCLGRKTGHIYIYNSRILILKTIIRPFKNTNTSSVGSKHYANLIKTLKKITHPENLKSTKAQPESKDQYLRQNRISRSFIRSNNKLRKIG